MLRSLFTSVLVVVVAGALVWGGCVSCQNLLPQKQTAGGCCENSGKCKVPAPQESGHKHCKAPALALEQYVKADPDRAFEACSEPEPVVAAAVCAPAVTPVAVDAAYSPPAVFLLNSTFRI